MYLFGRDFGNSKFARTRCYFSYLLPAAKGVVSVCFLYFLNCANKFSNALSVLSFKFVHNYLKKTKKECIILPRSAK
jgi:hypothetical protein